MLEPTASLLPPPRSNQDSVVVCVGFEETSLDEMEGLLKTLGFRVAERLSAQTRKISPATFIGKGKIAEAQARALAHDALALIFDGELSAVQHRNIERIIQMPLLDRPGVIIEIFSHHARSKEAKTQVELARLQYLLPRLSHFWTHFERQRGGAPGSRGMGETQIEIDRRLVKNRIALLKTRLREIEQERRLQRQSRQDVLKVALVGYTNAGKSTLLNALTHSEVLAEDQLFVTLDASVRSLDPDSHPPVVAIDTVGFISALPVTLVASFRSTLEEVVEADLLVHVVDASHPQAQAQARLTEEVLAELGADQKPRLTVLNKMDRLSSGMDTNWTRLISRGAFRLCARDPLQVDALREMILEHFRQSLEVWEVMIPYAESKLVARLHACGTIETTRHLERGTYYRLRIAKSWAAQLNLKDFRL